MRVRAWRLFRREVFPHRKSHVFSNVERGFKGRAFDLHPVKGSRVKLCEPASLALRTSHRIFV